MFKPVSPKVDFPKLEEEILSFWKENKTFEKSIENRPKDKTWTFLDGPPFVTGLPHYGHLLTTIAKDLFPRFWTMKGYRVRRVWGWDGHGLPVENKVEVKLGIKTKKEIEEKIGVKVFIDECKKYLDSVTNEWEWYVDRVARWVDFEHAYRTWDTPYMETVMWVFKKMYEKKLIYKGLKVSLYCPHCATPISNFEVAMDADNYKEIIDVATTYKYELKTENEKLKTYILAWSTTPWNKIITPALAVNPKLTYVKVKEGDEYYILAKTTVKMLKQVQHDIVEEFEGKDLIGLKFEPHYDYYPIAPGEKAFEIIGGDFVTADEGTGVVTIAAYGEEDLKAMGENNIHIEMHLDDVGVIKPDVPKFGGMYYLKANEAVNKDLADRGLIYKDEKLPHNIPLCWRCHTRLYYAPINAWYVNVATLKDQMKKTNERVNWVPSHFKHGRFLKSLQNAPDWNISRNRYWGSPVPVWECECGERYVPGSIQELEDLSGKKVTDLHKPGIDEIIIPCLKCEKKARRVPEVLDSWIEAGSASFGERHYPFDFAQGKSFASQKLEDFYPPDFIVEYTGQIRAWFYVLHVISNALYQVEAFKNVLVNGVILGTDGRKMSKNFGNYPDPKEMLEKYGADALRLYLMKSPVVQGEDTVISEEQYRNQVKGTMLILWNVYNFFVSYANIDKFKVQNAKFKVSENVLDQWILSLLNRLIIEETEDLEKYDTIKAIEKVEKFVNDLSTWYIRRSRDRVGPTADDEKDKQAFYETTYTVLTTLAKMLAPITPFLAEEIYKNLTGEESVHLTDWPQENSEIKVKYLKLIEEMAIVRKIVELGHAQRKAANIKLRQSLQKLTVIGEANVKPLEKRPEAIQKLWEKLAQVLKDELNIKELGFKKGDGALVVELDTTITEALKKEGEARDIVRKIQEERKKLGTSLDEYVNVTLPEWPKEFEEEITRKALVRNLTEGSVFSVQKI
ncbi:MAG: isoleucine--tRNA ligase [Candidatus Levybacteria bacterium]|nr:isoleucine--tRNA ligase [Candidatus Levybacteria bacterium]